MNTAIAWYRYLYIDVLIYWYTLYIGHLWLGDEHRNCLMIYTGIDISATQLLVKYLQERTHVAMLHFSTEVWLTMYMMLIVVAPVWHQPHGGRCGRGSPSGSLTQQAGRRNDSPQGQDQSGWSDLVIIVVIECSDTHICNPGIVSFNRLPRSKIKRICHVCKTEHSGEWGLG